MQDENDFSEETTSSYLQLLQELGLMKASTSSGGCLMNNPYQQAHRIYLGLSLAYSDGTKRPDPDRVNERARFMARRSKAKLLEQAVPCSREDFCRDPEYYESLAKALLLIDNQEI